MPLAEGGQQPRVLGQLPDPDVVDLAELLHVALTTLGLPENEEPKLIDPVRKGGAEFPRWIVVAATD